MKKIAYGLSYFPRLMREDFFFVDKTPFLEVMENLGEPFIFFLRPRRFGKSLWVSILQHYYGLEHREIFQELFGKLYIGQHPTPAASQHLVLFFEFSSIDTTTAESTFAGFLSNVRIGVGGFLSNYQQFFTPEQAKKILEQPAPQEVMKVFFETCRANRLANKIYLLIDEYDHFANELLAFRFQDFTGMVGRNGFVRKFYESIKTATFSGVVERLFVTGVSPITLDSLTSGFNIGHNLTTDVQLHDMMGFTSEQTAVLMRNVGVAEAEMPGFMADMERWYNGYLFNKKASARLYNADMVLYFANHYAKYSEYPDKMLDSNIASDYGKIRQVFRIGGREEEKRQILEEVLAEGQTRAILTDQFNFEKGFSDDDFKSMLLYMGYLTVRQAVREELALQIPNQVIRKLFWEYFAALTTEHTGQKVNTSQIVEALRSLTDHNDPLPLLAQVERTLEALSNRDSMKLDEKHVKAIFVSYANLSNAFFIKSEFEMERQYVDLLLLERKPFKVPHQFAFEFKYLPKASAADLKAKREEAHRQLAGYLQSDELKHRENLRPWVIVFVGVKLKVAEPLKE